MKFINTPVVPQRPNTNRPSMLGFQSFYSFLTVLIVISLMGDIANEVPLVRALAAKPRVHAAASKRRTY